MKTFLIILAAVAAVICILAIVGALLPREHTASRQATFRKKPAELFPLIRAIAVPPTYVIDEERTPERLVIRIADQSLPYGGTWTFEFRPGAGGTTTVQITEHGFVKNVIFRFLARFVLGYNGTMDSQLRSLGEKFGETVTPQPSA